MATPPPSSRPAAARRRAPRARRKRLKTSRRPARVAGLGHPGELLANVAVVGQKPRLGAAEDGQVDVDEQLGIEPFDGGLVARGHDQVIDALRHLARDARLGEGARRPGGALQLAVSASGLVDGVVEPQGECHLHGTLALPLPARAERQAFAEMPTVVVVTVRLAPGRAQLEMKPRRCWTAKHASACAPGLEQCRLAQRCGKGRRDGCLAGPGQLLATGHRGLLWRDYDGTVTVGASPSFFARLANVRSSNDAILVQDR